MTLEVRNTKSKAQSREFLYSTRGKKRKNRVYFQPDKVRGYLYLEKTKDQSNNLVGDSSQKIDRRITMMDIRLGSEIVKANKII